MQQEIVLNIRGSSLNYALSNHTTFSQTQAGENPFKGTFSPE
jgi:hypothetical protein